MPLPLTVSCFSEIQIGFTFLVPAHPGSPGKRAVKRVCVCATYSVRLGTEADSGDTRSVVLSDAYAFDKAAHDDEDFLPRVPPRVVEA